MELGRLIDHVDDTDTLRIATEQQPSPGTGRLVQSVPVSHSPRRRAVYRLVFATRSPYGLWVCRPGPGDGGGDAGEARGGRRSFLPPTRRRPGGPGPLWR
ncbi:hypothetical protein ACFQ3Z_39380 [Streptomyces nogalater]